MVELETLISEVDAFLEREHAEGYSDGYSTDTPHPGSNRSDAYVHSWEIGRAEKERRPTPHYVLSNYRCAEIRSAEIRKAMTMAGLMAPV